MTAPSNKMNTAASKTFSSTTAILLCVGAGLLALVLSIAFQARGATIGNLVATNPTPIPVAEAAGLGSSYQVPGQPERLIIPAIGVNAPIESLGLADSGDGEMAVPPNASDVAWYKKGPLPGADRKSVV